MVTKRLTALTALAMITTVVVIDLATSASLNPYRAPPTVALGSGQPASGAHCAAQPGQ